MAWEADDRALTRLFEPCGVIKVRLHTDKDTGKPKGFAHVHFRCARGGAATPTTGEGVMQGGGDAGREFDSRSGAGCAVKLAAHENRATLWLSMSPTIR